MKEINFRIKFELFGVQKIANVKAVSLEHAQAKLNADILRQVKVLSTEYEKPKSVSDSLPKEFKDIFKKVFGDKF